MADKTVGVPNQAAGSGISQIDTSEMVNSQGTTVERQRLAIGDHTISGFMAKVNSGGDLNVSEDTALSILGELRAIRHGIGILINVDLSQFIDIHN